MRAMVIHKLEEFEVDAMWAEILENRLCLPHRLVGLV